MSDEKKMEKLKKRIAEEKEYFDTKPFEKGKQAGMRDVMDFSYLDFMQLAKILDSNGVASPQDVSDAAIKRLYDLFYSKQKKVSVKIDEPFALEVKHTERPNPLHDIATGQEAMYYRGWFREVCMVWGVLKKSL